MTTVPVLRNTVGSVAIDADKIAPGLYQGSYPPPGRAVCRAGFDLVVFCAEELPPDPADYPGVEVVPCPLGDSSAPMTDDEWERAVGTGQMVAHWIEDGGCVLVTCAHGRNRSGIVAALALYELRDDLSGADIVRLIKRLRRARTGPALTNMSFVARLTRLP